MASHSNARRVPHSVLRECYRREWVPNLKIPLFYFLLIGCGVVAWNTESRLLEWAAYGCMGYLWMGIVTFMHDCTHQVLFKSRWKNWAFGLFSTIPIFVTFTAFMEDHLEHHRNNRSPSDPDAFTMGERGFGDFVLFYAYMVIGVLLTVIQFNFIYPFQALRGVKLWTHLGELATRAVVYTGLIIWTQQLGVLDKFLAVWLIPAGVFSLLNSIRFVAEHYGTPWDAGQLRGTRTIISNPVNRFFWNNINYHIGHHVYPAVPWYNLKKLHEAMIPVIEEEGAVVDKSYLRVFLWALRKGPETERANEAQLALRAPVQIQGLQAGGASVA